MKSLEVREQMADALTLDLIGPVSGLAAGAHLEREILPGVIIPSRWYLTGFLAPFESLDALYAQAPAFQLAAEMGWDLAVSLKQNLPDLYQSAIRQSAGLAGDVEREVARRAALTNRPA